MKFSLRVILWILLAAVPAWACDPYGGMSASTPVFVVGFVATFIFWAAKQATNRFHGPLGWLAGFGVIIASILAAIFSVSFLLFLPISFIPLLYFWVIYQVLNACLEYLFKEEGSWKEFHHNHRDQVNLALFLFLGGLVLKSLGWLGEGPLDFLHDDRIGFFLVYLGIGMLGLGVMIPVYWFRKRARKGSGQVFPGLAAAVATGPDRQSPATGLVAVPASVLPQRGE